MPIQRILNFFQPRSAPTTARASPQIPYCSLLPPSTPLSSSVLTCRSHPFPLSPLRSAPQPHPAAFDPSSSPQFSVSPDWRISSSRSCLSLCTIHSLLPEAEAKLQEGLHTVAYEPPCKTNPPTLCVNFQYLSKRGSDITLCNGYENIWSIAEVLVFRWTYSLISFATSFSLQSIKQVCSVNSSLPRRQHCRMYFEKEVLYIPHRIEQKYTILENVNPRPQST